MGAGIFASMHCAAKLANFINDPHNKVPDRKLGMLDAVVNIDEVAGALVLAGFPIVKTLKIENSCRLSAHGAVIEPVKAIEIRIRFMFDDVC